MSGPDPADETRPPASAASAPDATPAVERPERTRTPTHVPRTRVGVTWLAMCATALVCVVLIVFMVQNTRSTEISFLVWNGTLPLALALLIAAVGSAILTMAIGTARIAQLRRFSAKQLPSTRR